MSGFNVMSSFFRTTVVLIPGFLFGLGLAISGMLNPNKIIGFLSVFDSWDPSLALVMTGGVLVNYVGLRLYKNRHQPLIEKKFHLPTRKKIDKPLILGSAIFGVGWALSGFCPGPVVASIFINFSLMAPFFCILIVGLLVGSRLKEKM